MTQLAVTERTSSSERLRQVNVTKKRVCVTCGSDKTNKQKGKWARWYIVIDEDGSIKGYQCHKCKCSTDYNPRRMVFKDKTVLLAKNPRTGYCQNPKCPRKGKKQKTDMHHTAYHDDDPLRDTIELCDSCHGETGFTYKHQERKEEQDSVAGGDGTEVVAEAA